MMHVSWLKIIGFLCLNLIMSALHAEAAYRFERLWPRLPQPWYFSSPSGIAVAADGSVFVVDTFNHRIQHFRADGVFINTFGRKGDKEGEFYEPEAITIASDGTLWVADRINNRIQKFSHDGNFLLQFGAESFKQPSKWVIAGEEFFDDKLYHPSGLAIAADGSLFIADSAHHLIQKFDAAGKFLANWKLDDGGVPSNYHYSVVISPKGQVWVTNLINGIIQVFDVTGHPVIQLGPIVVNGTGPKHFTQVAQCLVDASGEIQSHLHEDCVKLLPYGLAFTPDGSLWISNWDSRMYHINIQGIIDKVVELDYYYPRDIARSEDGSIWLTNGDSVQVYDSEGVLKNKFMANGFGREQITSPSGITLATDGTVWVAEGGEQGRIHVFDQSGSTLKTIGPFEYSDSADVPGGMYYPRGIAQAVDGTTYILNASSSDHKVQVFDKNGRFVRKFASAVGKDLGQLDYPQAIALTPDGQKLWIVDAGNQRLQLFDTQGTFLKVLEGKFQYPTSIAIDSKGQLWVVDQPYYDSNILMLRLQIFDASGKLIKTLDRIAPGQDELGIPRCALTVAPNGHIWLVDAGNNQILEFDATGQFINKWGSFGNGDGQFQNPTSLAVDAKGRVYVADTGNHRIQVFSQDDVKLPGSTTSNITHPYKAIILAGGGPTKGNYINHIWDSTLLLTNKAFGTLRGQGFAKDEVSFLTAGSIESDLDKNGQFDDLQKATLDNLKKAITDASDANNVLLYLVDHGGPGRFQINNTEILTEADLNSWLDQLNAKIPGQITVIIESCKAGSFFPTLAHTKRQLIASSAADQAAIISNAGSNAFSYFFWSQLRDGAFLSDAFKFARQAMISQLVENNIYQNAQLDSNGDGQFSIEDYTTLGEFCIGRCVRYAANSPSILSISPVSNTKVPSNTALNLTMQVNSLEPIIDAWVVVKRPDFTHANSDEPISDLPRISLTCNAQGICNGQYDALNMPGEYQFNFYALDAKYQQSLPVQSKIILGDGQIIQSTYDTVSGVLTLPQVEIAVGADKVHYYVELQNQGNYQFAIKAANQIAFTQSDSQLPSYRFADSLLNIPLVYAAGKYYQATLTNDSNFIFSLQSASELH